MYLIYSSKHADQRQKEILEYVLNLINFFSEQNNNDYHTVLP